MTYVIYWPAPADMAVPLQKVIPSTAVATQRRQKKEAEVKNLCLSDLYLKYRLPPYGLLNLKNKSGVVTVMMFV